MSQVNPKDVEALVKSLFWLVLAMVLMLVSACIQAAAIRSVWGWYVLKWGYAVPPTMLLVGLLFIWHLFQGFPSFADAYALREIKREYEHTPGGYNEFLYRRVVNSFTSQLRIISIVWITAGLARWIVF